MRLAVAKAAPLPRCPSVEGCVIAVEAETPEFASLHQAEAYYAAEADRLAEALFGSLPQGTLDRLLIHLMQRKLSLYRGVTES